MFVLYIIIATLVITKLNRITSNKCLFSIILGSKFAKTIRVKGGYQQSKTRL